MNQIICKITKKKSHRGTFSLPLSLLNILTFCGTVLYALKKNISISLKTQTKTRLIIK